MIQIDFSREELEAICRRRAVKRLALLGSVVRDDFGPDSDVDVLIEFCDDFEGKQVYKICDELTALFGGRRIDLVEVEFVNKRIRDQILDEAQDLYAA